MWNKSLMWNSPKMWNRPKEVEQAQRGGTGPKINHTCFLADLASLGRPSLRSGQLLKKGGTREMWNKSLMCNSPKMWNRPKEMEQAQRGGTGPKINHTCSLADLASLGQRSSLRSAPRFAGQL